MRSGPLINNQGKNAYNNGTVVSASGVPLETFNADTKQDQLTETNLKTVGGESLLGAGNVPIPEEITKIDFQVIHNITNGMTEEELNTQLEPIGGYEGLKTLLAKQTVVQLISGSSDNYIASNLIFTDFESTEGDSIKLSYCYGNVGTATLLKHITISKPPSGVGIPMSVTVDITQVYTTEVREAPEDGEQYARQDGAWTKVESTPDAVLYSEQTISKADQKQARINLSLDTSSLPQIDVPFTSYSNNVLKDDGTYFITTTAGRHTPDFIDVTGYKYFTYAAFSTKVPYSSFLIYDENEVLIVGGNKDTYPELIPADTSINFLEPIQFELPANAKYIKFNIWTAAGINWDNANFIHAHPIGKSTYMQVIPQVFDDSEKAVARNNIGALSETDLDTILVDKQDILVSGDNIKTIGGIDVLGSGNIDVLTRISCEDRYLVKDVQESINYTNVFNLNSTQIIYGSKFTNDLDDSTTYDVQYCISHPILASKGDKLTFSDLDGITSMAYYDETGTRIGTLRIFGYTPESPILLGEGPLGEFDSEIFATDKTADDIKYIKINIVYKDDPTDPVGSLPYIPLDEFIVTKGTDYPPYYVGYGESLKISTKDFAPTLIVQPSNIEDGTIPITKLDGTLTELATDEEYTTGTITTKAPTVKQVVDSVALKADKADTYTKDEIDNKLSSAYVFKGTVDTLIELEAITDAEIGDVYDVIENGTNYAWDGTKWDSLAGIVDLSALALKTELPTKTSELENDSDFVVDVATDGKTYVRSDKAWVELPSTIATDEEYTEGTATDKSPSVKQVADSLADVLTEVPTMTDTIIGGGKAIVRTTETRPVAIDANGLLWYEDAVYISLAKVNAIETFSLFTEVDEAFVEYGGYNEFVDIMSAKGNSTLGLSDNTTAMTDGGVVFATRWNASNLDPVKSFSLQYIIDNGLINLSINYNATGDILTISKIRVDLENLRPQTLVYSLISSLNDSSTTEQILTALRFNDTDSVAFIDSFVQNRDLDLIIVHDGAENNHRYRVIEFDARSGATTSLKVKYVVETTITTIIITRLAADNWTVLRIDTDVESGTTEPFTQTYTQADLTDNNITIQHNLNIAYPTCTLYDNNKQTFIPNNITVLDNNNIDLDLTGLTPIDGTWSITVAPGAVSGGGSTTYTLPVMTNTVLGGGKAIAKTTETGEVAVDGDGKLWYNNSGGGGGAELATDEEYNIGTITTKAPTVAQVKNTFNNLDTVPEAPEDTKQYAREDGTWTEIIIPPAITVENVLDSTSTTSALSAAQGKAIKDITDTLDGLLVALQADKADKTTTYTKTEVDDISALKADKATTYTKLEADSLLAEKAELVGGKIPAAQLPSFVDDVIEAANFASLPATGEVGKIYVTLNDNKTFRWTGAVYAQLDAGLVLGETVETAYRGDRGKLAYDHTLREDNPHNVTQTQVGLENVNNTSDIDKPISTATQTEITRVETAINTKFNDYSTTEQMNTKFADYSTTEELNTKFAMYSTTEQMNAAIQAAVNAAVFTALEGSY